MNPALEAPREEYLVPAALLALAMHGALALLLVAGVHWQSRAPDVVSVELWRAPPEPAPEPTKAAPAAPPPKPVVQVKPEPRIQKPDIAVKAPPEKPKPKPKPAAKAVPKPKPDDRMARQLLAQAIASQEAEFAADRERDAIKAQFEREAQAAQSRAMQAWVDKIRGKIRGNLYLPPGLQGNPEALVLVTLLPTGDVLQAKLVISSGSTAYDEAVLRAILKSSPLPKPDSPSLFERDLKLTFHPLD
ncbi:MAG: energy transducer TonB [Burkholderiales bacterium]